MSDELFPVETVLKDSPRLSWLKRHGLETEHLENGGSECPETGDIIPHWVCRVVKSNPNFSVYAPKQIGSGDTEDEACADLAQKRGIRLWFEESP